MNEAGQPPQEPAFGLTFRVIVGGVASLSGVILWLWAAEQGAIWKYLPALFCFCVFGIVALPRSIAVACGYLVALTVLVLCGWFLYLGLSGKEPLWNALRFGGVYGLPALAFILYRQLPGATRKA